MVLSRLFPVAALVIPLVWAGSADACPPGGGNAVFLEPEDSEGDQLFEAARQLDRSAVQEDQRARSAFEVARRQRQIAANLRERARVFPDLDASLLLAKADLATDEAVAAESRARSHTTRARALRARATELRSRAKRIFGAGPSARNI